MNDDDYIRRAETFRPADPVTLLGEVMKLAASQGLTPHDIAQAMRLDPAAIRQLLEQEAW
jgi:hypothetical protein